MHVHTYCIHTLLHKEAPVCSRCLLPICTVPIYERKTIQSILQYMTEASICLHIVTCEKNRCQNVRMWSVVTTQWEFDCICSHVRKKGVAVWPESRRVWQQRLAAVFAQHYCCLWCHFFYQWSGVLFTMPSPVVVLYCMWFRSRSFNPFMH